MGQDESRVNRTIFLAGLGAAALVLLAGAGWAAFDAYLRPDPGVGVCESIREHRTVAGDADGDGSLTLHEYQAARSDLADSSDDRIRDSGVKLMDTLWNASTFRAVDLRDSLTSHAMGLQSACADAGVIFTLSDAVDG